MRSLLVLVAIAGVGCVTDGLNGAPDENSGGKGDSTLPESAQPWDLNDVSMLMPFPAADDLPRLLQPASHGEIGDLLPQTWLDRVPTPLAINIDHATTLAQLRMVAVRIDPCFRRVATDACRPVVRMIWQPFMVASDGTVRSVDAALHSFYELTPSDFDQLTHELSATRDAEGGGTEGLPLDVHPIVQRQGTGGTYWSSVKAILLAYCGETSLIRMTAMQLSGRTNLWVFSGFEKDSTGSIAPMQIARIDVPVQQIAVHAQPPRNFDGGLFGEAFDEEHRLEPSAQADLNTFLRGTVSLDLESATTQAMLTAARATTRFLEVPSEESTSENIDCASCHIAQAARVWIDTRFPSASGVVEDDFAVGSPFDLTNVSTLAGLTNQLRAFGYFRDQPVISQRVIHESALVADQLRQGAAPLTAEP